MRSLKITHALAEDVSAIKELLAKCALPFEDLTAKHLRHFYICQDEDALIGVVGLEPRGDAALLRSLAVRENFRGSGLGLRLVARAEEHARSLGAESLYLLTTSAERFFTRCGYEVIARGAAPKRIQATEEFASICPSSSVCMVKRLRGQSAGNGDH